MAATLDPSAIYSQTEAAAILGRRAKTLREWRRLGIGPASIKTGAAQSAKVVYMGRDILAWLEARRRPAAG